MSHRYSNKWVRSVVEALDRPFLSDRDEQLVVGKAARNLLSLAENEEYEYADVIVAEGAVPALMKCLRHYLQECVTNYMANITKACLPTLGRIALKDNISHIIKVGGFLQLRDAKFSAEPIKHLVTVALEKLEDKIHGPVLEHLFYLMRTVDVIGRRHVALALAHLCSIEDCREIFIDNNGIDLLLDLLTFGTENEQFNAFAALNKLAHNAFELPNMVVSPPTDKEYLGEEYVNNPALSDVTFLVEDQKFYANTSALVESSEVFHAMLGGRFIESDEEDITIPEIGLVVFELMMRFMCTGSVDMDMNVAEDLLRAADRFDVKGLKHECEIYIEKHLDLDNIFSIYVLSEEHSAISLKETCIFFILGRPDEFISHDQYFDFIPMLFPGIRNYFSEALMPKGGVSCS